MRRNHLILVLAAAMALTMYACKSVETTSAMLHNQTGNYDEAIEQAKLGLEKNPQDAEAYFQLGVSYSYIGEMGKAYESFTKAAEIDPSKTEMVEDNIQSNWARHFNAGISEFQTGNLQGAAKEFEMAAAADPREIKGWLNLARTYNSLAEEDSTYFEESFTVVDTLMARVDEEDDSYGKVLELAGKVMVVKGETDRAYEILEKLMRDDPVNAEIVESVGNDFLRREQYADAVRFYSLAADGRRMTETESFDLYYNMGVCYLQIDEFLLAADAFRSALNLQPDNKRASYSLLLSYYSGEFWDEAILQGQKYTEQFPDDPKGWQILSLSFTKKGMKIKAEDAARRFQELSG